VEAHPRTQTGPRTLGEQMGAELSALCVKRCSETPSGLRRPVWISRMTKPAEDPVAGEFNPASRLETIHFRSIPMNASSHARTIQNYKCDVVSHSNDMVSQSREDIFIKWEGTYQRELIQGRFVFLAFWAAPDARTPDKLNGTFFRNGSGACQ